MDAEKPTLKDIARAAGVSATTVHRSLHGKGGVGKIMDEEIKRIASELGYRSNYLASTLKRKDIHLAIALPEPILDYKYYYLSLWRGVRKFLKEIPEFGIKAVEFYYPFAEGSNGAILREIYEKNSDDIDGLLTIAVDHNQSAYFLEKLNDKGIPIVLVGSDLYKDYRLCCVKTYDEVVGQVAAELLTAFNSKEKKVILSGNPTGTLSMLDQFYNINGFEKYISEAKDSVELIHVFGTPGKENISKLKQVLEENDDIYAIYSSSARHTMQMCKAVIEMGLEGKVRLIGNDCFKESVNYLKQGVLTAIIDKKIPMQSYLAMKTLFDYVVKGEYPSSSLLYVQPSIVMKSNVEKELQEW